MGAIAGPSCAYANAGAQGCQRAVPRRDAGSLHSNRSIAPGGEHNNRFSLVLHYFGVILRQPQVRIPVGAVREHMGLQISSHKVGDVTLVELRGRATLGPGNDALSAELRKLAEANATKVLVNLEGVTQMDSSGISTVVRSFVTFERRGGKLKLLKPSGHVREVLELTRLSHSIPTFDDESAALASFR